MNRRNGVYGDKEDDWLPPNQQNINHSGIQNMSKETNKEEPFSVNNQTQSNTIHSTCERITRSIMTVISVSLLLLFILFYTAENSFITNQNDYEDKFTIANVRNSNPSSIIDMFGIFNVNRPSHEITLDLSLEQINKGYIKDYEFTTEHACPHCHGHGSLIHHCPICGGAGVIHTHRGIATCNHCHGQGYLHSEVCPTCGGQGKIMKDYSINLTVQPGALDGSGRVYTLHDGSKVLFKIHQKKHPVFTRGTESNQFDLYTKVSISLKEALLGTTVPIKTITGEVVKLIIPPGVQPFEELKMSGHGLSRDTNSFLKFLKTRGDLYVTIEIDFPNKLSEQQINVIKNVF